jgi:hypothetical protein
MRAIKFFRMQMLAAMLLTFMAGSAHSVVNNLHEPQGELINRPDGPYACLPREPACIQGL